MHWDETFEFLPEVYYPKEHVTYFPWGECDEVEGSRDFKKIYDISHITHTKNIDEMDNDSHYCFQPKKKYGKCGYEVMDGSPLGESYRCGLTHIKVPTPQTRYTPVTQEDQLLPDGYYIWWGTSTTDSSMYGNGKLTTNLRSALGTFKFGQTHDLDSDLFLRVGGTLRYKKEICYVIIVHTEAEATDEIKRLPPLHDSDHFRLNGFLHEDGRVDWKSDAAPEFISRSYDNRSTDYFTFAFYFNDCDSSLNLKKEKVIKSSVRHNKCVRKFKVKQEHRPHPGIKWYCPEDKDLPKGYSQEQLVDNY